MEKENTYYATGKRKTAIARTWLKPGSGQIRVNDRPLDEYFPVESARALCLQPLMLVNARNDFDIRVRVGEYLGSIRFQEDRLDLQVRLYRVAHVAGEFDLREHEELRWVEPEQLEAYDLVDSDRQLIRRFRASLI